MLQMQYVTSQILVILFMKWEVMRTLWNIIQELLLNSTIKNKQTKQIHDLWLKRNNMEDYYLNQELNMKINTNQGYDLSLSHVYK